jgi:hypothetical protein
MKDPVIWKTSGATIATAIQHTDFFRRTTQFDVLPTPYQHAFMEMKAVGRKKGTQLS